ncbi:MAG: GIY-YIG nuclease family protein [Anaeromyxobacteraceae bacterium]
MAARRRRAGKARGGWRVYFLRCGDGSLYAGATNDMARRVASHAAGKGARYTRSRLPVTLVYEEPVRGRGAALRREAALKRLSRKEKLALVASATPPAEARGTARQGRGPRRSAR